MIPTRWGWRVAYPEKFKLGYKTDIGCYTYIQAEYGVEIGDYAYIGGGTHIYSKDTESQRPKVVTGKVIIGRNVNIGAHCLILPGVEIPDHTRIPAKSIVK
jgi:acetyltransferase-like isoleucine patch superfamily enzyme